MPPLQVLDAVAQDSVEMTHTGSLFFTGKDSAFAFGTTVPFMLNTRQQNAWDAAHPNPLTWERRQELEAEFAEQCVPVDRS